MKTNEKFTFQGIMDSVTLVSMVMQASDDNPLQSLTEAKIEEWCEVDLDLTDSEIGLWLISRRKLNKMTTTRKKKTFQLSISLELMQECVPLPACHALAKWLKHSDEKVARNGWLGKR